MICGFEVHVHVSIHKMVEACGRRGREASRSGSVAQPRCRGARSIIRGVCRAQERRARRACRCSEWRSRRRWRGSRALRDAGSVHLRPCARVPQQVEAARRLAGAHAVSTRTRFTSRARTQLTHRHLLHTNRSIQLNDCCHRSKWQANTYRTRNHQLQSAVGGQLPACVIRDHHTDHF